MATDPPRKRRLNPEAASAFRSRVKRDTDPAAIAVYAKHPRDSSETGHVLCCRALHPLQNKLQFRGRMHGVEMHVHLPEGYIARFTRVLGPGEAKHPGRMALKCPSRDCHAISEYEIALRPNVLAEIEAA